MSRDLNGEKKPAVGRAAGDLLLTRRAVKAKAVT